MKTIVRDHYENRKCGGGVVLVLVVVMVRRGLGTGGLTNHLSKLMHGLEHARGVRPTSEHVCFLLRDFLGELG